jgi:hypothetical protein
MNIPEGVGLPADWPEEFRKQLSFTNSHLPIIEKIGVDRATIGIFETFSMVRLPEGFLPVMKIVGATGNLGIEENLIGYEGQSKELANYSIVAVQLAMRLLPGYEKKAKNIRKIIRLCTGEVLNHTQLCRDIEAAARNMARPKPSNPPRQIIETKTFDRFVIDKSKIDYMSGRPIDWATSHWWSGE